MLKMGCFGPPDPENSDRKLKSAQLNSTQMKKINAGTCSWAVAYEAGAEDACCHSSAQVPAPRTELRLEADFVFVLYSSVVFSLVIFLDCSLFLLSD